MRRLISNTSLARVNICSGRRRIAGLLLCFCFATSAVVLIAQQSAPAVGLPARAPGYEHYYRNEDQATAFATRWGYADGWRDGQHDREVGKDPAPADQDRYKLAPDHGLHPGIPRATYKTLYRTAYLHGYERGSGSGDQTVPVPQ